MKLKNGRWNATLYKLTLSTNKSYVGITLKDGRVRFKEHLDIAKNGNKYERNIYTMQ